jgi:predicted lipoprotein with Yx(FWY)xxD motif
MKPVGFTTGTSEFGPILVNAEGHTLYFLLTDRQSEATCLGECENIWPPFQQEDRGSLDEELNEGLVGLLIRADGVEQVTYNGWPLYLYRDDAAPGDMNGHGALNAWFALGPNGGAVGVTE